MIGDNTNTTQRRTSGLEDATPTELIALAIDADRDAASELVHRYERLVWSVIRSAGIKGCAAEDISQTLWATFFTKLHTIRNPEALAGWLATVARNAAMAYLRKASRERPVEAEYLDIPVHIEMTDDLEKDEEAARLVRAFNQLPADTQNLLRLIAADVSYKEISEILDRPVGAIGPTRMRALETLRRLYLEDETPLAVA